MGALARAGLKTASADGLLRVEDREGNASRRHPSNVERSHPRKVELHRRRAKRISPGGIERC
jgi:hypothetical protein